MLVAYADVSAPRANVFMLLYMRVALRLFSMAAAVIRVYANDPGGRTVVVYKLLALLLLGYNNNNKAQLQACCFCTLFNFPKALYMSDCS